MRRFNKMEKVAEGDYSQRMHITSGDELGRVGVAINTAVENTARLMEENKEAGERERRAQRLADRLSQKLNRPVPCGTLDITLYRDDLNAPHGDSQPQVRTTEIGFDR